MSLTVSTADFSGIASGGAKCVNAVASNNGKAVAVIVFSGADGSIKACLNKCAHMDSKFAPDVEDMGKMKCTFHGWKLDPATMSYVEGSNPKVMGFELKMEGAKRKQPELTAIKNADGSLTLTVPEGMKVDGGGCVLL